MTRNRSRYFSFKSLSHPDHLSISSPLLPIRVVKTAPFNNLVSETVPHSSTPFKKSVIQNWMGGYTTVWVTNAIVNNKYCNYVTGNWMSYRGVSRIFDFHLVDSKQHDRIWSMNAIVNPTVCFNRHKSLSALKYFWPFELHRRISVQPQSTSLVYWVIWTNCVTESTQN